MATVLCIGDTHTPGMRRGYISFLQRTADIWQPDRVVHIGDAVDNAAISFHEKLPNQDGAGPEFNKAKKQFHTLARAFPDTDWLIGNHDALTARQAQTAGVPPNVLKGYEELWEVDQYGWTAHPRFAKLQIDGVLYSHGDSGPGGKTAALNQARTNFQSTVIGHFHAQAGVSFYANENFRIFGMSVGCGIDVENLAFNYGRKFPAKPILGCGIVVDGKEPFFIPWLLRSK